MGETRPCDTKIPQETKKKKIADYGVCELTMPCIPEVFLAYIYTLVYKYDQPTRIMLKSSLREPV